MKKTKKMGGWRLTVWHTGPERKPVGDLCMPDSHAVLGILAMVFGAVGIIIHFAAHAPFALAVLGLASFFGGIPVLLAWKNRVIRMLPGDRFEYTTAFGRKRVYAFSDISELRKGFCCRKLILGDRTIEIDPDAVISERLRSRLEARERELGGCA